MNSTANFGLMSETELVYEAVGAKDVIVRHAAVSRVKSSPKSMFVDICQ